jgi:DsbC/DsbD-like thiol-disulfide interchange protein
MLSDGGSTVIRRYGLLNTEAQGRTAGIPHPGTFIVDRRSRVVSRSFEAAYQERATVASQLAGRGAGVEATIAETAHVRITASASDEVITPGARLALFIDIEPKPKMHVYAPGQASYLPVAITLAANDAVKVHPVVFPEPETYTFKPLNERQLVYSKPFRLTQQLTVPVTPATRQRGIAKDLLEIIGTLDYQACDDSVCYRPVKIPLKWTVRLEPLVR